MDSKKKLPKGKFQFVHKILTILEEGGLIEGNSEFKRDNNFNYNNNSSGWIS